MKKGSGIMILKRCNSSVMHRAKHIKIHKRPAKIKDAIGIEIRGKKRR